MLEQAADVLEQAAAREVKLEQAHQDKAALEALEFEHGLHELPAYTPSP